MAIGNCTVAGCFMARARHLTCLAVLFLALWGSEARACLNDTSSSSAEGEFRSRYLAPVRDAAVAYFDWKGVTALIGGIVLIGAVVGLMIRRSKAKDAL